MLFLGLGIEREIGRCGEGRRERKEGEGEQFKHSQHNFQFS